MSLLRRSGWSELEVIENEGETLVVFSKAIAAKPRVRADAREAVVTPQRSSVRARRSRRTLGCDVGACFADEQGPAILAE